MSTNANLLIRRSSMPKNWTEAQSSAISADRKKLLVSAAAGSGKTATLIERIIRSVTRDNDPIDINRMLIVTFTRAAASELRLRVMRALNDALAARPDSDRLRRQLLLLESAQICTIDSFCLNVIRKEFQSTSHSADFRIGDENELSVIRTACMDEAVEDVIKECRSEGLFEEVYEFLSVLSGTRRDDELSRALLDIRRALSTSPEGIEIIRASSDALAKDSETGDISDSAKRIILSEARHLFSHIKFILQGYLSYCREDEDMNKAYSPAMYSDLALCEAALDDIEKNDYFALRELIYSHKFEGLGSLKKDKKTPHSEHFYETRDKYKKSVKALILKFFMWNKEDIRFINDRSSAFLSILYRTLKKFEELYDTAKRKRHILEFDDLKRGAYRLFVGEDGKPTPLAKEYASDFDIIYIDEYQDVDPLQDGIFFALAEYTDLFLVGDIKQSIYGFRGSEPAIFGRLRKAFPRYCEQKSREEQPFSSVYMSENFRCSDPVIKVTNKICSPLFLGSDPCFGAVGYTESDDLVFAKGAGENPSVPCEFVLINKESKDDSDEDADDDGDRFAPEIRAIVRRIHDITASERKEDGSSFKYSDIAVLCDKNDQVAAVCNGLSAYGIPADEAPTENFFSSPEILLIYSLLCAIDNPMKDVPLTSTLLSPLFSFTDDEIFEVCRVRKHVTLFEELREYAKGENALAKKCGYALSVLSAYSQHAEIRPIDEFIPFLWNELDLDAVASFTAEDGRTSEMRRINITRLYDYAVSYQAGTYRTLHDFLFYLDELIEENPSTLISTSSGETNNGNRVHVLTIHRSKGLEFPVCFLFGAGYSFKGKTKEDDVIFDRDIGICFDPAAQKGLIRIRSPYREAALCKLKEEKLLEKIRLLYVALTRARERLIVTASRTQYITSALSSTNGGYPSLLPYIDASTPYTILHASCYAEWILRSEPFSDNFILVEEEDAPVSFSRSDEGATEASDISEELAVSLTARFDYPYEEKAVRIPAKLAVSRLYPTVLDEDPSYRADRDDSAADTDFSARPTFLSGERSATGADRGTATHLFLQFCNLDLALSGGVKNEAERLVKEGFLSEEHLSLIRVEQIERFFKSSFFSMLNSSARVYREQRFNLPFPASKFSADKERRDELEGRYVLVQGVIDIVFETKDGKLILADYKTDYITDEERRSPALLKQKFKERYGSQLYYYSLAVRQLFGRGPDHVVIYSLPLGDTIEFDSDDLG